MTDRTRSTINIRTRKPVQEPPVDLASTMTAKVVGQPGVVESILPYIEMFQAGLAPDNRPAGVFLLLGPTGTGKTRTVEALAEALHGSAKCLLKIDCGEFQMEHEVAKLIGAPPGYLGHRETQPMLTQQKLSSVTTEGCGLSLVLFDEIEKAAPSMARLLLGVLDRGVLRLGDNTAVNFEKSLVFLTSNLGAREMRREISPDFGFHAGVADELGREDMSRKLKNIALVAMRRKFSPEFINRIDQVVTYQPLAAESFAAIVDHEVEHLQRHIQSRMGIKSFLISVPFEVRRWLVQRGTSTEYGARELKRTVHRNLTQPLAAMVARNLMDPGDNVLAEVSDDGSRITLRVRQRNHQAGGAQPTLLLVDDNQELLQFLERSIGAGGWDVVTAESVAAARKIAAKRKLHAALVASDLPDGSGVELLQQLGSSLPDLQSCVMQGEALTAEDAAFCAEEKITVVQRPFLPAEVAAQIRRRLMESTPQNLPMR